MKERPLTSGSLTPWSSCVLSSYAGKGFSSSLTHSLSQGAGFFFLRAVKKKKNAQKMILETV